MPQAVLPKLVIYPQSSVEDPSVIYGTIQGLKILVAAINNVLSENQNLNTRIGAGSKAHFEVAGQAYQVEAFICTEEFMDTLPAPFFDNDEAPQLDPVPLPSVVKMWRHILAMTSEWKGYTPHERAYRVINAYKTFAVRNRVCAQMLLTAMRKMPDWYQDAEAHLTMSKAINAVIDLHHPDSLILRTELDAANVIIADLRKQVSDLENELAPC